MNELLVDIQLQAEKNIPTTEILVEIEFDELEEEAWWEEWMESMWEYNKARQNGWE